MQHKIHLESYNKTTFYSFLYTFIKEIKPFKWQTT